MRLAQTYRNLLKKFIEHVASCEGHSYTTDWDFERSEVYFDKAEIRLLQTIEGADSDPEIFKEERET